MLDTSYYGLIDILLIINILNQFQSPLIFYKNTKKMIICNNLKVAIHDTVTVGLVKQRFAKIGVLVLNLHIVLYFCGQ
jgi:small neutral amino acid transporter SnatA (MarC family)